ncbi:hypothetical protein [Mycoplasma sp. 1018B]|uniref:hypothetical protein n=1 Tax=Mycoplasma sp. 1018B TaxID=2967302 RepID=UPI00211C5BC4|nr:hypothetical protein [Mycoplasma sp. 1018B]UUM19141.1 hypothetical protein NPA14_02285 [Mycoplasma sp. 1018B]
MFLHLTNNQILKSTENMTNNVMENNKFEISVYLIIPLVILALLYSIYSYHIKVYMNSLNRFDKVTYGALKKVKIQNKIILAIFIFLNLIVELTFLSLFFTGHKEFNLLILISVSILTIMFITFCIYKYFKNLNLIAEIKVDNKLNFTKFNEYSILNVKPEHIFINRNRFINPKASSEETFKDFFESKFKRIKINKINDYRFYICKKIANNSYQWANFLTNQKLSVKEDEDNLFIVLSCSFKMLIEYKLFSNYDEAKNYFETNWIKMVN